MKKVYCIILLFFIIVCILYKNSKNINEYYVNNDKFSKEKLSQSSCAVVFNSGTLLKKDYGNDIDSYDYVIRFNMHPIKGYEKHVGTRTDIQVVHFSGKDSPGIKFAKLNDNNILGLTFFVTDYDEKDYYKYKKYNHNWFGIPRNICDECKNLANLPSDKRCSSGMLGVLWAMEHFKNISIFGGISDPCYPFHYQEKKPINCDFTLKKINKISSHNFRNEHKLYQKWNSEDKIKLIE